MDKLEDLQGRHTAHIHRYSSFTINQIVRLLERSDARLTLQIAEKIEGLTKAEIASFLSANYRTKRLLALRENIRDMGAELRRAMSQVQGDNGKQLSGYEVEHASLLLQAAGISEIGATVTASQAYAAAMSRPFDMLLLKEHIKDLEQRFTQQLLGEIRLGFINGESSATILRRIRGTSDQRFKDGLNFRRNGQIDRIIRTANSHIANSARLQQFSAAGISQVWLLTVLDGRQSKICAAWNPGGRIKYYPIDSAPNPPFHPNCRTLLMPKTKFDEDLDRPFVADDRPVAKIPKDQRKGKVGRTKASTFETWFNRQSVNFHREWLGPTRYRLWKDGGIPLTKFADPRKGKVYNIDELRSQDRQAFIDSGLLEN